MKGKLSFVKVGVVLLFLFLFFPSMTVSADNSFSINVYSSKESYDNGDAPFTTLTEADATVNSWGEYKFSAPDIPVPEGSKLVGWTAVRSDGTSDFYFDSSMYLDTCKSIVAVYPTIKQKGSIISLKVYSSKESYENGEEPYVTLTDVDATEDSSGNYKFSAPDVSVPEGSKLLGWTAVQTGDYTTNFNFTYSQSYSSCKSIVAIYPNIKQKGSIVSLKVYSSKESYENGEEPYVTLTDADATEWYGGYKFTAPEIPAPDGYEFAAWTSVSDYGSTNDGFSWYVDPSYNSIKAVYPTYREVKDSYTVEFYDGDPVWGSPTLLKTIEVANGGKILSSDLPDISVPDGSVISHWSYRIKNSDNSYSDSSVNWWYNEQKGGSFYNDVVKDDIALFPEIISEDRHINTIVIRPNPRTDYSSAFEKINLEYKLSDATQFGEEYYIKLGMDSIPVVENYIFDEFEVSTDGGVCPIFSKDGDTFTRLQDYVPVYLENLDNAYFKISDKFGFYELGTLFIDLHYIPASCTVTIKDAYYDTDGTTLIETKERTTETVEGNGRYTSSALDTAGFTCSGYRLNSGTNIYKFNTFTHIIDGNRVYTFVYVKNAADTSGGRVDIPVETTADGTTKTDFVADSTILGGDLIVSIPAEMILTYDAENSVMTKTDYVSATGRCASTSKLEIKTLTSITYANDADNSISVPGTIAFGTTSGDYQVTDWSAPELLTGVKTPANVVKKNITASVQKDDIDYVGIYGTSILYNISVLDEAEGETT